LAGDAQCAKRSPVESALRRDDPLFPGGPAPLACKFQRALDRLGARITEERKLSFSDPGKSIGQLDLGFGLVEIRDVDQDLGLFFDCFNDMRMTMTNARDCDPGDQVQMSLPGIIEDFATVGSYDT
jgi:hypothetical protein